MDQEIENSFLMNPTNLSDYQLYEIIQNEQLDQSVRKAANDEFNQRKLSLSQIEQLITKHDAKFIPDNQHRLQIRYKILLVLFPFFIEILTLVFGRMLAMRQRQKWKDYWLFICLGYLIWTAVIILFAKYFLFKH